MFKITNGSGFHITFENGYTISVQFGPGNYADNYDEIFGPPVNGDWEVNSRKCGKNGSRTAECAVIKPGGGLITLPHEGGDTVTNRSTPAEVLALMIWAASLPGE